MWCDVCQLTIFSTNYEILQTLDFDHIDAKNASVLFRDKTHLRVMKDYIRGKIHTTILLHPLRHQVSYLIPVSQLLSPHWE
jgi:hypothetical protein